MKAASFFVKSGRQESRKYKRLLKSKAVTRSAVKGVVLYLAFPHLVTAAGNLTTKGTAIAHGLAFGSLVTWGRGEAAPADSSLLATPSRFSRLPAWGSRSEHSWIS